MKQSLAHLKSYVCLISAMGAFCIWKLQPLLLIALILESYTMKLSIEYKYIIHYKGKKGWFENEKKGEVCSETNLSVFTVFREKEIKSKQY